MHFDSYARIRDLVFWDASFDEERELLFTSLESLASIIATKYNN